MESIIDLKNIETLPYNTLTILKDNLGSTDIYSLCLKNETLEQHCPLDFRFGFVLSNEVPICILMLKIKNKIYKSLISFDFIKELDYLKKLLSSQTFNLFLFSTNNENMVYKIENKNYMSFLDAITAVEKNIKSKSHTDIVYAKKDLLNKYTDEELWNLSK